MMVLLLKAQSALLATLLWLSAFVSAPAFFFSRVLLVVVVLVVLACPSRGCRSGLPFLACPFLVADNKRSTFAGKQLILQ
jgi:hypothetical protein